MANAQGTRTVYHYTDWKGKEGIERTGRIKTASRSVVYFTTMPPTAGKRAVSMNNWRTGIDGPGKADYAVVVEIPACKLKVYSSTGRDIITHDGPVDLDCYKWRTLRV